MKWTVNEKSLLSDSPFRRSKPSLVQTKQSQFQRLIMQEEQHQHARTKRKRNDDSGTSTDPRNSEGNILNENLTYCGQENVILTPEDSLDISNIRNLTTINRKELKILRMQVAMISDADGDRPIHMAVVQQNMKLLQKLCAIMLKTAISVDLSNYLRQTPLHLAVMLGNIEMVKLLLRCGSSITLRDRKGNSVIHLAVKTDAKKEVLDLILSHPQSGAILNLLDHEGYTALHYAVLRRNKSAVTSLHLSGVDMNVMDGKSGRTVLIHAVMAKNTEMVKHLLEFSNVSINAIDYSGRSVFDLALQASNQEIVKLLEKKMLLEGLTTYDSEDDTNKSASSHRTKKLKFS